MAVILRVAAVIQMALGAAGFLAAFGVIDPWPGRPAPTTPTRDWFGWLAFILVSAFLFNFGGVLWLAVRNAYRPPSAAPTPAAAPTSPTG